MTCFRHWHDEKGRRVFHLSRLQRDLFTFDMTLASWELRVCTCAAKARRKATNALLGGQASEKGAPLHSQAAIVCLFVLYLYTRSPENKAKGRNTLPDASAVENKKLNR